MKKFNEIINENNEGVLDNTLAVELIVKDFEFINKFLFPYIKKELNTVENIKLIYRIADNSFKSTILYDQNNEPYLKYFNINFNITLSKLSEADLDIGRYFTTLREVLSKSFKLKNDSILKGGGSEEFSVSIDYDLFLKSDLYKSMKGIDKFKL